MTQKLSFQNGNAKLEKGIYTFALPAGHTCPGAGECMAKADRITGKVKDGQNQRYRCFSAGQELYLKGTRKSRWDNFDKVKNALKAGKDKLVDLILTSIPRKATIVRIHVSGDFFSLAYFDAWLQVAKKCPQITFYAYTKSLTFWEKRKSDIPHNLALTASLGGKWDEKAKELDAHIAKVLYHPNEAKGLTIDHDDSSAYKEGRPKAFGLLLHGMQPAGTKAAKALVVMKREGVKFSYPSTKPKQKKDLDVSI